VRNFAHLRSVTIPWFLEGDGVCREAVRSIDWARTPLGRPESWPSTLQTTLATLFLARQPMMLMWGPDLIQFYNDAFLPSFGRSKHPKAMGQPGRECWQEVWPIIGGQIEGVLSYATPTGSEDALVPIFRNGRVEEVYWTYTYSPAFAPDGTVAGVLVICTETTGRVLAERRTNLLHTLVAETSAVSDHASLVSKTFEVFGNAPADLPWAALYRSDRAGRLTLATSTGMSPQLEAEVARRLPTLATLAPSATSELMTIEMETGSGVHGQRSVYVTPIHSPIVGRAGFVVLGINPTLSFDAAYRRFAEQVTSYLQAAATRIDEMIRRGEVEIERRNLLEQAPVAAALLVGPHQIFEIANPLFRQMVGRPDIVGKAYLEAFPELKGTALSEVLRGVYDRGEPFVTNEYGLALNKGNGVIEDRVFKFNLEPVRDVRGEVYGMMAIAVEITDQVNARRALEKANSEREALLRHAEAAGRAKDEFLAMLGHELRNPLAPISTALQLSRRKGEGTVTHEHEIIERQVNHLTRLVDDLLDVAKIARGKVELRRENVDLHDVVAKALEMAGDLLEERHHHLTVEYERGRFFSNGDPIRLAQVVANLLTNAAKYTDIGGAVTVKLSREGAYNRITVRDNGIGIGSDLLPRVFDLFEQGHRARDRAAGGLGIGLALVKNLVVLHEGFVSGTSEGTGRGSEFTVSLPAVASARAEAAPPQFAGRPSRPSRPSPNRPARVLVVDDNVDALEMLKETLEMNGHRVAAASDPLAALDLAEAFSPEIAVIDIGLPVIDGYELSARLRAGAATAGCRMIALTGYGQEGDQRRSRAAGFDEHLVKPVNVDRLTEIIETMISNLDAAP
jgi:signal transduction histidine kinase/CheY-like chemotaxis protein